MITTLCSTVPEEKNVSVGTEISYHYLGQPPDHSTCFLSQLVHIRPSWTCGPSGISIFQGKRLFPRCFELWFSYLSLTEGLWSA